MNFASMVFLVAAVCVAWPAIAADYPQVINLWPGKVPDESETIGPERVRMSPKSERKQVEVTEPTRLITGVTNPTITIHRPPKEKATGTAILICPGGGYWDLYWQLEGEEVAAWLNSIGVTGIILKYRVPRRADEPKGEPARRPLQDAQRAVSLVRSNAKEWGIDPQRIGIVGFSAGGHLAIATATSFEQRTYEPVDDIDKVSCRPDFAIPVYSGYLKAKDKDELAPGLRVPTNTPPVFLVHGSDDIVSPPEHSVVMYLALKKAGIPSELHLYANTTHDFGVRTNDRPYSTWTDSCARWLRDQGFLKAEPDARATRHVKVYAEPGRFGGWPANHGIWSWGNEILVGFSAGHYKDLGPDRHHIDREKPEEHLLARSRDGGETWIIENPAAQGALIPTGKALHGVTPPGLREKPWQDCPGGIDFTHPDFAMTLRMTDVNAGLSRFYYSTNRGLRWEGPFRLPMFDQPGVAARTDCIVNGRRDCLLFLTASKENGREGRPFCASTTDGGRSWQFVSWISAEPKGYAIMPSTVRLGEQELLTAIRCRDDTKAWIETYRSLDNGRHWKPDAVPAPDLGEGNPPGMIRLKDGRVCLTYGHRAPPYGIRARLSKDGGRTWGREIFLREDGGGRDVGYPRTVQRPDGKIVTVYYFHDQPKGDRYIAATLWSADIGVE